MSEASCFDFSVDSDDCGEDWGTNKSLPTSKKNGIIFLVDGSSQMLLDANDNYAMRVCLQTISHILRQKAVSCNSDVVSVIFFATQHTQNSLESLAKHVFVFQDLSQANAQRVIDLESLANGGRKLFTEMIGHCQTYPLVDALWICSSVFSNFKHKVSEKRIILLTNRDDPYEGDSHLLKQAFAKAKDLHGSGISLDIVALQPSEGKFCKEKFYSSLSNQLDGEIRVFPGAYSVDSLLDYLMAVNHNVRVVHKSQLSILGTTLALNVYSLVLPRSKTSAVRLYNRTNEEVFRVTRNVLKDTGEVILEQDIKHSIKYADKEALFEREELSEMRNFGETGMNLLGFVSRLFLKDYYYIRPAHFIYPDEATVHGSIVLFAALLERMLHRNVLALCSNIPRRGSLPVRCLLLPQKEEIGGDGEQVQPPGFHVLYLPFAEDIRDLEIEPGEKANSSQISCATALVRNLTFSFRSNAFPNPSLEMHEASLEALALDRDELCTPKDLTEPSLEWMQEKAYSELEDFKDMFFPDDYAKPNGVVEKKRKVDLVDVDIPELARTNSLFRLTVPSLREACDSYALHVTGRKKDDYILALMKHFGVS